MGAASAKKQVSQSDYEISDDDDMYETRSPSNARKYIQPVKPVEHDTLDDLHIQKGTLKQRRSAPAANAAGVADSAEPNAEAVPSRAPVSRRKARLQVGKVRRLPLFAIFGGMVAMALLVWALSSFGAWWQVHQNDVTYGRPRTYQFDAVVGHNDSAANPTHFICINLNRHVEVIEFPGGDATHARVYQGPVLYGDGQDLTPVTATIRDVNGDGKPDLIVHIQDQQIVFINDGTQFRPLRPGEQVNLGS